MIKHKKPLDYSPSKQLIQHIDLQRVPKAPIADVGCGYGRNGLFFLNHQFHVDFIDIDTDALKDIELNFRYQRDNNAIYDFTTICLDLYTNIWPFNESKLGGIICVDFLPLHMYPYFTKSLMTNGFLYIETISARGENWKALPPFCLIYNLMYKDFDITYRNEHLAKPYSAGVSTLKILGYKK